MTIAGWGYLSATGTIDDYATIASREDGTTIDQHYHISINSRGEVPALWLKTEIVTKLLEGPTAVTRQTWVHIAGTYDGTTARLYVNGQLVDSQPLTGRFVADTTPFILGANGNGVGRRECQRTVPRADRRNHALPPRALRRRDRDALRRRAVPVAVPDRRRRPRLSAAFFAAARSRHRLRCVPSRP